MTDERPERLFRIAALVFRLTPDEKAELRKFKEVQRDSEGMYICIDQLDPA